METTFYGMWSTWDRVFLLKTTFANNNISSILFGLLTSYQLTTIALKSVLLYYIDFFKNIKMFLGDELIT